MAAVNASPTYHGRPTVQAHHKRNSPLSNDVNEAESGMGPQNDTTNPHYNPYYGYYSSRTGANFGGTRSAARANNPRLNDLGTSRRITEHNAGAVELGEENAKEQDYEIQHLRTQAQSIGVLEELLADSRIETQCLQEVVDALVKTLHEHGVEVGKTIQKRFSQLRFGSLHLSDSSWSIELKRPPSTVDSHTDMKEQILEVMLQLKKKEEECKSLKEENATLHQLLQASDDKKSEQITRLEQQLRESCQDRQSSTAICRSLSGEAESLKVRLHRLSQECVKLSAELTDWKERKRPQMPIMSESPVSAEDQLRVTRQQVKQLELEKGQLAGQLKEVMQMNKRWQKYNRQQDSNINALSKAKKEAEDSRRILELQCGEYEESMVKLRLHLGELEEQVRDRRVEDPERERKNETIRKLNKKICDLEDELRKMRKDGSDYDMDVVKQQMKQYTDDFQKERSEKEKLEMELASQEKNLFEMEKLAKEYVCKLQAAEKENRELKQREMRRAVLFDYQERNRYRKGRELTPHGYGPYYPVVSLEGFPTLPDDVLPDGMHNAPSSSSPPVSPPLTRDEMAAGRDCVDGQSHSHAPTEEPLQCPRCLREFPVAKHTDFMRHTEVCMDT